jgi:hypothetical protein
VGSYYGKTTKIAEFVWNKLGNYLGGGLLEGKAEHYQRLNDSLSTVQMILSSTAVGRTITVFVIINVL